MLTNELMGLALLGIAWVTCFMIMLDAFIDVRAMAARLSRWKTSLVQGTVTAPELATHEVEQRIKQLDSDTPGLLFFDRKHTSTVHGGAVQVGGETLEVTGARDAEVWPAMAALMSCAPRPQRRPRRGLSRTSSRATSLTTFWRSSAAASTFERSAKRATDGSSPNVGSSESASCSAFISPCSSPCSESDTERSSSARALPLRARSSCGSSSRMRWNIATAASTSPSASRPDAAHSRTVSPPFTKPASTGSVRYSSCEAQRAAPAVNVSEATSMPAGPGRLT